MNHDDLLKKSAELLKDLEDGNDESRTAMLPDLEKHISDLHIAGLNTPVRLKELKEEIHDIALEDSFDNMPL